ncbi:hypothetical protein OROHE_016864 [Orobanche hederae]
MIWRTYPKSKVKLHAELAKEKEDVRTEAESKKENKTRGPSKGLALDSYVSKNSYHKIIVDEKYWRPILASDAFACMIYCRNVGFIIRGRVPILWAEWKYVPQYVNDVFNNAMCGFMFLLSYCTFGISLGRMGYTYFGRLGLNLPRLLLRVQVSGVRVEVAMHPF